MHLKDRLKQQITSRARLQSIQIHNKLHVILFSANIMVSNRPIYTAALCAVCNTTYDSVRVFGKKSTEVQVVLQLAQVQINSKWYHIIPKLNIFA